MPKSNAVQLASVRVITDDLPRLVRFYAVLTGATPQYLTDDFVELVTPSATFALSGPDRVAFISENTPRAGANNTAIVEFLVEDTEALYTTLENRVRRPRHCPSAHHDAVGQRLGPDPRP